MVSAYQKKNIINKLQDLPTELLEEVEDFVDFLKAKHQKNKSGHSKVEEPIGIYGAAKDTIIYIADDFNEPLDEMKDYM